MPSRLDPLFLLMRQQGSTDLHLAAGASPRMRVRGELEPMAQPAFSAADLDGAVQELLSTEQKEELAAFNDVEFTYAIPGVARVRGSAFLTASGPAAVFRLVAEAAVPMESLGLPHAFTGLLERRSGLVLVAVPMGSGRSTLIASIVDRVNGNAQRHILSLEDPVEVVHKPKKGIVVQREVGRDASSFAAGIRDAMRTDVEVIVSGDLPDHETSLLAMRAAESGRLVIAFTPVPGTARAIERMIETFPMGAQAEARSLLADNLIGVLSQVLVRRKDGPARVAAHELLLAHPDLASALREGELREIAAVLDAAKGEGMSSLDDALAALFKAGVIGTEEAHRRATDKSRFA